MNRLSKTTGILAYASAIIFLGIETLLGFLNIGFYVSAKGSSSEGIAIFLGILTILGPLLSLMVAIIGLALTIKDKSADTKADFLTIARLVGLAATFAFAISYYSAFDNYLALEENGIFSQLSLTIMALFLVVIIVSSVQIGFLILSLFLSHKYTTILKTVFTSIACLISLWPLTLGTFVSASNASARLLTFINFSWAIASIIFSIMLSVEIKASQKNTAESGIQIVKVPEKEESKIDPREALKIINELHSMEAISDEDYKKKKEEIIDSIINY